MRLCCLTLGVAGGQVVAVDSEYRVTMTTTCPQSLEVHSSLYLWEQIVDQVQSELIVTNNNLTQPLFHQKLRIEYFGKQLMNKFLEIKLVHLFHQFVQFCFLILSDRGVRRMTSSQTH